MPPLKSIKRETFCRKIIEGTTLGLSQADAYLASGYRNTQRGAEVNASKLMSQTEIQTRIAELMAPAVKKTRVSIESLSDQFDAVFTAAMQATQLGAAGSAAAAKAKLLGFMRDRLEVGGVGEFDGMTSEEVLQRVRDELGDEITELLIARQARSQGRGEAILIEPPRDANYARRETENALATLRPKLKPARR